MIEGSFHEDGVEVGNVIISVQLYGSFQVKTKVVGVASKSERTKPIIKRRKEHCDWLILLLLLPTPTISGFHEIANDGVVSGSRKKMETS